MPKIRFSSSVWKSTKQQIHKEILSAAQSSPELRREMSRVFQQANRRIQNIERSGLYSPAVAALNIGEISGFTKFGMSHSWDDLKHLYGKAVSFLRQPTSTATGTRQYNEHIRNAYGLSKDEFDLMSKHINNKLTSLADTDFVERYLMRYNDFTGELEQAAADISQQIETDAQSLSRAIDREMEEAAENAAKDLKETADDIRRILEGFNGFGL